MKKLALILFSIIIIQQCSFADVTVYSSGNKFGLQENGETITKAKYKKLIRLGTSAWIMQDGTKYGILNDKGEILIEPVYNQAERMLGKYAKFRKGGKYCLLNEYGDDILGGGKFDEDIKYYSSIDLLYNGLIVTSINHKYGLNSFNGNTYLENIFDDIYMPDRNTIVIVYGNKSMEFKRRDETDSSPFCFIFKDLQNEDLKLTDITSSPIATTGYYGVTFTDYILKLISSISPAYEETIDELVFSQGADTVSVLMRCTWLPKFPFVYAKNYYNNITNPANGPLNKAKKSLRKQIKD